MPTRGGLPYYITADCGRPNFPTLWFMASLPHKILSIFDNRLLLQMTSKLFRIKCIFMKIMQQHYHSTIYCKVRSRTEKSGLCVCDDMFMIV